VRVESRPPLELELSAFYACDSLRFAAAVVGRVYLNYVIVSPVKLLVWRRALPPARSTKSCTATWQKGLCTVLIRMGFYRVAIIFLLYY